MSAVYVRGIGLAAPGLVGWAQGTSVLAGREDYAAAELPRFAPALLPANERRRTTATIRIALEAAQQAVTEAGLGAAEVSSVFASSDGDMEIVDKMCSAMSLPERGVSPTHFHNSVHNAPAGYWAIAAHAQRPSVSISAFDASFAAGLLEAVTTALADPAPVLLVAYDYPPPAPLDAVCPVTQPFAVALVLQAQPGGQACWRLTLTGDEPESTLPDVGLEALRTSNPAARSLPLLHALAQARPARVALPQVNGTRLLVDHTPCT
jgi:hypothetical protein